MDTASRLHRLSWGWVIGLEPKICAMYSLEDSLRSKGNMYCSLSFDTCGDSVELYIEYYVVYKCVNV